MLVDVDGPTGRNRWLVLCSGLCAGSRAVLTVFATGFRRPRTRMISSSQEPS